MASPGQQESDPSFGDAHRSSQPAMECISSVDATSIDQHPNGNVDLDTYLRSKPSDI